MGHIGRQPGLFNPAVYRRNRSGTAVPLLLRQIYRLFWLINSRKALYLERKPAKLQAFNVQFVYFYNLE
jgi:hypothetical protein